MTAAFVRLMWLLMSADERRPRKAVQYTQSEKGETCNRSHMATRVQSSKALNVSKSDVSIPYLPPSSIAQRILLIVLEASVIANPSHQNQPPPALAEQSATHSPCC